MEEEKKRAEQDKRAAIAALEERSREFFKEREHKRQLEAQINVMKSQLISGGVVGYEGAPTSKRESLIARKAYEKKMQELESERTKLEESKAQVDRYKGLLQKQRDIMIALATRLNERDEAIVQMQEELDAYDKIHKDSESHVKNMRSRIRKLESHLVGHGIDLPKEDFHDDKDSDNSSKKSEGVKLDDVETLNVTYNNLLSPDEKILELAQIADRRKAQISELKEHIQQINRPPPQLSQALEENKQLRREAESYRMELNCLMSKQSNQSSLSRCSCR